MIGKTAQVCVHFQSVAEDIMKSNGDGFKGAPTFLVVSPASVLKHWIREIHHWSPRLRACVFHGISKEFSILLSNNGSIILHL